MPRMRHRRWTWASAPTQSPWWRTGASELPANQRSDRNTAVSCIGCMPPWVPVNAWWLVILVSPLTVVARVLVVDQDGAIADVDHGEPLTLDQFPSVGVVPRRKITVRVDVTADVVGLHGVVDSHHTSRSWKSAVLSAPSAM